MNDAQRITVDLASMPEHVREELAAATLDSVMAFLKQPGGREFIDARKAEKKAAKFEAAK